MMVWQVRTIDQTGDHLTIMDVNLFDSHEAIKASIEMTYCNRKEDMPFVPKYFPIGKTTKIRSREGSIVFEVIPTQVYSIGEHL